MRIGKSQVKKKKLKKSSNFFLMLKTYLTSICATGPRGPIRVLEDPVFMVLKKIFPNKIFKNLFFCFVYYDWISVANDSQVYPINLQCFFLYFEFDDFLFLTQIVNKSKIAQVSEVHPKKSLPKKIENFFWPSKLV